MVVIYILLAIIAIGVLLASEEGKKLLGLLVLIGIVGLVIYVGFYFLLFGAAFFMEYKDKIPPIVFPKSEYDWVPGAIFGILLLSAAVYKALFPLGYDKKRQIWTGKLKKTENEENVE